MYYMHKQNVFTCTRTILHKRLQLKKSNYNLTFASTANNVELAHKE